MKKRINSRFVWTIGVLIIVASCTKVQPIQFNGSFSNWDSPDGGGGGGGYGGNYFVTYINDSDFIMTDFASIQKGTQIVWINNDSTDHSIISNDGTSFNSGNIAFKGAYAYTTNIVDTFYYHCGIHGESGVFVVTP